MKTTTKLVLAILVAQLIWYFLPQIEWRWMSEDALVLTSYSGFESRVDFGVWLSWGLLAATLIITAGLIFFGAKWRYLFLGYIALTQFVYVPLSGMNIETGLSMAFRDLLSILFGALIAIILIEESQRSKSSEKGIEA